MQRALAGFIAGILVTGLIWAGVSLTLSSPDKASEPETASVPVPFMADPTDFHVSLCDASHMDPLTPCLLVQAGGKRLVFGAPLDMDWTAIGPLDGVFLLDGAPASSLGLMGLRYETWFAGRRSPLRLVAGELMLDTVEALDDALLVPDAQSQIERPTALDSRIAGFVMRPVPPGRAGLDVFNTGDLIVTATSSLNEDGDQQVGYLLQYGGGSLMIRGCGASLEPLTGVPDVLLTPAVSQIRLTERLRDAVQARQEARAFEIRKTGRICSSPAQIREFAGQYGIDRLVLLASGDDYPGTDTDVQLLGKSGLSLLGEE